MFIRGIGTAVPRNCYSQPECWEALCAAPQFGELTPRARAILRKVLGGDNGIATRHLVLENLAEAFQISPDVLHARFARHAPALAVQAALRAMEQSEVAASRIEAILISTCTGYLCPGLTSYVAEALRLKPSVLPLDIVGQGCGAALPNLMTAQALLAAGRNNVLSICVEICSAAFYLDNDPGVLISACLFGDGAGAAVLGHEAGPGFSVKWAESSSSLAPGSRESLRFQQCGGMLRNVLAPEVPELAAEHVDHTLQSALKQAGLSRAQVRGWVVHPGGRDVLAAISRRLRLREDELRASASILRQFGNLSSPSVYFVLEAALRDSVPRGWWWMSSFGAGFSCHGALLQVDS